MTKVVPASYKADAFNCVYCGAYAHQVWNKVAHSITSNIQHPPAQRAIDICTCHLCHEYSIWVHGSMLVPATGIAPMPHEDMPADIKADFNEARDVFIKSPRSSAALLRLALQKLCGVLGESGRNINGDIANLVSKGLPVQVQQSLDIIRVVGNEQVHPGQLDVRDDPSIAVELFGLINFIIEDRITRPNTIGALYSRLPKEKRDAIELRDKPSLPSATL
jgi:hypothetical protein